MDERDYPRVSTVLREMGLSKPFPEGNPHVEWGRARGTAVHKAIELYETGRAMDTLHPDVLGPYTQYLRFKDEVGYTPLAWEEPVVHPGLRYRGTLDSRGVYKGEMAVLDFKCSKQPDLEGAAYQLGAYALALAGTDAEGLGTPFVDLPPRWVIQLGEDSYRVHDVTSVQAVTIFEAASVVYWAQREKLAKWVR